MGPNHFDQKILPMVGGNALLWMISSLLDVEPLPPCVWLSPHVDRARDQWETCLLRVKSAGSRSCYVSTKFLELDLFDLFMCSICSPVLCNYGNTWAILVIPRLDLYPIRCRLAGQSWWMGLRWGKRREMMVVIVHWVWVGDQLNYWFFLEHRSFCFLYEWRCTTWVFKKKLYIYTYA